MTPSTNQNLCTPAKILAKIRQIFPDADPAEIQRLLDTYAGPERLRVQVAILKLSEEDRRDSPAHYVDTACQDYRNVLAWAESPQQLRPDWFSL